MGALLGRRIEHKEELLRLEGVSIRLRLIRDGNSIQRWLYNVYISINLSINHYVV